MSALDFDLKTHTGLHTGLQQGYWSAAQQVLAKSMAETAFQAWIAPLRLAPQSDRLSGLSNANAENLEQTAKDQALEFKFTVANRFKLEWLRAQYGSKIHHALVTVCGCEVNVSFVLAAAKNLSMGANAATNSADNTTVQVKTRVGQPTGEPFLTEEEVEARGYREAKNLPMGGSQGVVTEHNPKNHPLGNPETPTLRNKSSVGKSFLNPLYTFATLVEGNTNRMARAAGLQISQSFLGGTQRYNPFYIYGGVGLGKTHLMHAIGNALLQSKPQAKIHYVHAEQFVTDVVRATQRKSFDEFKAVYHDLDLLLIDDVQFFGGKERTQEEFFNAFEALLAKQSQIVLSSDTYPKALSDISSRLVSRFDQGLTTAIEPPELELRVAILLNKAEQERVALPDDVAFFIAKHIRSNVRELEGALRKVMAWSRFNQEEINIGLCKKALRDLLSIQNQQVSVENIQKTVADYYKIKVADMFSKRRPSEIAFPRQIAMYLAKEMTQKSLPEIGNLFGGKDHTTVLHAVRKISGLRAKDLEFSQVLHVIEQTLKH